MASTSRGAAHGKSAGVSVLDFSALDSSLEATDRKRLEEEGAGWMTTKEIAERRGWGRNRAKLWATRLVEIGLAEQGEKRIIVTGSGMRMVPAYRFLKGARP